MACTVQKQSLESLSRQASITGGGVLRPPQKQRGSLPTEAAPPDELQWPPVPVSMHTSHLRLTMMNEDPKDLHTARLIINELRTKIRCQSEHIMKWRKAYAMQIQQHFRYQKEKSEQMNSLTSQLLLLESRLKRKQKQICGLLNHRELAIQRQQKVIDMLSNRLLEHGIEPNNGSTTCIAAVVDAAAMIDTLNDSDSAVVLEDIDSDTNMTTLSSSSHRRRSSGGAGGCGTGGTGYDGITVARSISDAIETSLNKYANVRRNNCYLRRPEILETVYSVEEDPEPTSDVAEKRDKFKNRSEKVLSSSSTEGHVDDNTSSTGGKVSEHTSPTKQLPNNNNSRNIISPREPSTPVKDGHTVCSMIVPQIKKAKSAESSTESPTTTPVEGNAKSQVTKYNRVMSNHRSVTKPKDVKYKRINKAKSKSLEELRGRLKDIVEPPIGDANALNCGYKAAGIMPQTAQSYA